jgi:hypothetical protein
MLNICRRSAATFLLKKWGNLMTKCLQAAAVIGTTLLLVLMAAITVSSGHAQAAPLKLVIHEESGTEGEPLPPRIQVQRAQTLAGDRFGSPG